MLKIRQRLILLMPEEGVISVRRNVKVRLVKELLKSNLQPRFMRIKELRKWSNQLLDWSKRKLSTTNKSKLLELNQN